MPAGVSMGRYLTFSIAAILSMFAGSQTVHIYYQPLRDLDKYIEREKEVHKRLDVFQDVKI